MRRTLLIAVPMLLAGCGPAPTDPGPGGVSVEDAEALDDAAARLDEEQANPPKLTDAAAD